jgi:HD-GYP domain-containing protein (c-di-GMP phosphodiesterase class II)
MMSVRPYRKSMSIEAAVSELRSYAGKQFDPEIVEAFFVAFERGTIAECMHQPLDVSAAVALSME